MTKGRKKNQPCNRIPQNRSFKVLRITFLTATSWSGIRYTKKHPKKWMNSRLFYCGNSIVCYYFYVLNMREKKRKKGPTLRERAMAIPTMNKKKGITKSARLQPFHGACPIICHSPPASSTNIINYTSNVIRSIYTCNETLIKI